MLVTISDKELNRINIIQAVSEKGLQWRYPNRPNWSSVGCSPTAPASCISPVARYYDFLSNGKRDVLLPKAYAVLGTL